MFWNGLACRSENCIQCYSLGKIATLLHSWRRSSSNKSLSYDPIWYQIFALMDYFRMKVIPIGCHCVHKISTPGCRVGVASLGVCIDVCFAGIHDNDSLSARIAPTHCKRTWPRTLYCGLSQCERTCGHGNSGSVSQCRCGRGGLSNRWTLFGVWKISGNLSSLVQ